MKRIYISGPMSGCPDWNYPVFNAAEEALHQRGFFDVVNPARLNPVTTPWETCLRADIKALCDCDVLALLEGWEGSKGAHLEVHIAHRLGIKVVALSKLLAEPLSVW